MAKRGPKYQAFPPGDHIREEIEDRGWTQTDLARIMGRPLQVINEIINGRKAITAQTARELEAALGASAELWMNLETSYRLYKEGEADPEISARAKQRARPLRKLGGVLVKPRDVEPVLVKPRDVEQVREVRGSSARRPRSKAAKSN